MCGGFWSERRFAFGCQSCNGKENVIAMPSLIDAMHYCFASYYIFHISFPSDIRPLKALGQYISGIRLLNLNTAVTEQVNGTSTT